jgi:hypothetical protein
MSGQFAIRKFSIVSSTHHSYESNQHSSTVVNQDELKKFRR